MGNSDRSGKERREEEENLREEWGPVGELGIRGKEHGNLRGEWGTGRRGAQATPAPHASTGAVLVARREYRPY